jgi:hypothetical protein
MFQGVYGFCQFLLNVLLRSLIVGCEYFRLGSVGEKLFLIFVHLLVLTIKLYLRN